nr:hypothetical protein [Tanacetum cinerariifolium]
MSFMLGTSFGFYPLQFFYPPRRLTMEEMLYKFIDEGRREHEEIGAFIIEFKTTNELLLKERNNLLSELEFEVDKFILPIDFVILDMREDFKIMIILRRPFLAIARAMIDVFNKKITLRVGNKVVIFDVDQSTKRPPTEDDECYGIDFLDTTIYSKTQELLEDDQLDSFLVDHLEESIDLSDSEKCGKVNDIVGSWTPIRCIEEVNMPYLPDQIMNIQQKDKNIAKRAKPSTGMERAQKTKAEGVYIFNGLTRSYFNRPG